MIKAFIKIRFKQLFRGIRGIGLIRILFIIGLLAFISLIIFTQTEETPRVYYTVAVYLGIILFIHIRRQDKLFLKSHFKNDKIIFLAEYLFLTTPLLICLVYHLQWISIISVLIALPTIVNFSFQTKQRSLNTMIQRWIPSDSFEWKAGIRKSLFPIIALMIVGLGTSFFIGSIPIVIFILGIIPLSFYEKGEPYQMIIAFEMNATQFLLHKINLQFVLFTVLVFPLIVLFIILHTELWYIPIVEYFIFISFHIYFILLKYAFYEPNSKSGAAQIFGTIGAIGAIIPVLIPIIWLLSIRFYFKSIENLNFYLNDYN